jgi:hypothetical protein
MEKPRSKKKVQGVKGPRLQVKGKEVKTLEPWNPVFELTIQR